MYHSKALPCSSALLSFTRKQSSRLQDYLNTKDGGTYLLVNLVPERYIFNTETKSKKGGAFAAAATNIMPIQFITYKGHSYQYLAEHHTLQGPRVFVRKEINTGELLAWHYQGPAAELKKKQAGTFMARIQMLLTPSWSLPASDFVRYTDAVHIVDDLQGVGGCILTDGCGYASPAVFALAGKHLQRLGVLPDRLRDEPTEAITAMQIRTRMIKGMLVRDASLDGFRIFVPKSMVKVTWEDVGPDAVQDLLRDRLEVAAVDCKGANCVPRGRLNVETIPLLESGGVTKDTFLQYQRDHFRACARERFRSRPDQSAAIPFRRVLLDRETVTTHNLGDLLAKERSPVLQEIRQRLAEELDNHHPNPLDETEKQRNTRLLRNCRPGEPVNVIATVSDMLTHVRSLISRPGYHVPHTWYVRIVPDWSGELKAGECYVHINGKELAGLFLFTKLPTYVASDAIRLTAVPAPPGFARRFPVRENVLWLSAHSLQERATADLVSDADYDGDAGYLIGCPKILKSFEPITLGGIFATANPPGHGANPPAPVPRPTLLADYIRQMVDRKWEGFEPRTWCKLATEYATPHLLAGLKGVCTVAHFRAADTNGIRSIVANRFGLTIMFSPSSSDPFGCDHLRASFSFSLCTLVQTHETRTLRVP